ncbi:unnamed protein product [Rangifer tarandus platyrhynchus]|uniref:Uncharacterized protein n=2 Tax=Rangifer tarandus platyrhynchus TaxID=3082113 RepID=A0AC59ZRV6_RANTA|nr:unnamed protein product [Rangifer tarandus platyrhynchus]
MPYRQEQTQGWRKPGGVATAAGSQKVSLEEEAAELGLNQELPGNQRTGHMGSQGTLQGGGSAGVKERDGSGGWRVVEERMAVSGGAIWKAFQALCLVDVILGSSGWGVLLH